MAKTNNAVLALAEQYSRTLKLLRRSIQCFSETQWLKGISQFEVPSLVAYHTLQCLLFYFREDPAFQYGDIPKRFQKDWWELNEEDWPYQDQLLLFLDEVEGMVMGVLNSMTDEDLSSPFPVFGTKLGNIVYSLRHTMHHQGGLNVLSVHHGIEADLWDQD